MSERRMFNPTPELPDDTPIDQVEFSPRVRDVLVAAGQKTVDEVRETADETLMSFQDLGKASVAHLRDTLGLQPPNLTTRREKTDIPTLLSADILALLLHVRVAHPLLWNVSCRTPAIPPKADADREAADVRKVRNCPAIIRSRP
jgi:Bacterial RNA polymerase, alpha chain C terminal domain